METQTNEQPQQISLGLPVCQCRECWKELLDQNNNIDLSVDNLKDWFYNDCPGTKAA